MTMAGSWSYTPNDVYKPTNELIEKLVDIVSKGGNYLLNIGPSPDGELAPDAYNRMQELGEWLKTNGEAIYGTRMYKTFGEGDHIRFTQTKDGKTQFVFLFHFPEAKLNLHKLPLVKGDKVQMLGTNKILKWTSQQDAVIIEMPAELQSASKHVWVLKVTHRE
jgi:alpha-L-fucosidase